MGNGYDSALVLMKMGLKPLDTFCVKMVRRLVQKQDIRLAEQESAQCHTSPFSSAQIGYPGIGRRTLQRIHGTFKL